MSKFASPEQGSPIIALSVEARGIAVTQTLRTIVNRILFTSLDRFIHRTREIIVWLEDINGPRGGVDTRCRLNVCLQPSGRLTASARVANEFAAVAKAANRARLLLDRKWKRATTRRRREKRP
jgi:putative sigma-54 modulation protein